MDNLGRSSFEGDSQFSRSVPRVTIYTLLVITLTRHTVHEHGKLYMQYGVRTAVLGIRTELWWAGGTEVPSSDSLNSKVAERLYLPIYAYSSVL